MNLISQDLGILTKMMGKIVSPPPLELKNYVWRCMLLLNNHRNMVKGSVPWSQLFGPSVDDQAVSLSDDGTTIIIDFFSLFFLSFLFFYRHSTRHTLHLHFNPD